MSQMFSLFERLFFKSSVSKPEFICALSGVRSVQFNYSMVFAASWLYCSTGSLLGRWQLCNGLVHNCGLGPFRFGSQ